MTFVTVWPHPLKFEDLEVWSFGTLSLLQNGNQKIPVVNYIISVAARNQQEAAQTVGQTVASRKDLQQVRDLSGLSVVCVDHVNELRSVASKTLNLRGPLATINPIRFPAIHEVFLIPSLYTAFLQALSKQYEQ